jgi:hypothetical protein
MLGNLIIINSFMNATVTTISLSEFATDSNSPKVINQKVRHTDSQYILLIDDVNNPVKLKNSSLDLMELAMIKNPNAGMVYADYEIITKDKIKEIHLLKHHIGRVRDNQDCGKVFLFRKSFLVKVGGFDEELKHHYLYDIRLRISEVSEIIHTTKFLQLKIKQMYLTIYYQMKMFRKKLKLF